MPYNVPERTALRLKEVEKKSVNEQNGSQSKVVMTPELLNSKKYL